MLGCFCAKTEDVGTLFIAWAAELEGGAWPGSKTLKIGPLEAGDEATTGEVAEVFLVLDFWGCVGI